MIRGAQSSRCSIKVNIELSIPSEKARTILEMPNSPQELGCAEGLEEHARSLDNGETLIMEVAKS